VPQGPLSATGDAVAEAVERLGRPDRARAWAEQLAAAAAEMPMVLVLVHADIHEDSSPKMVA